MNRRSRALLTISSLVLATVLGACSTAEVVTPEPLEGDELGATRAAAPIVSPDEKIAALSDALSKAQIRIEELDARVSSLSDRVDRVAPVSVIGNAVAPAVETPVAVNSTPSAPPLKEFAGSSELAQFSEAMALYNQNKFTEAVLRFHSFTEAHPTHLLAGSARFHAGESYLRLSEHKMAADEFQKVIQQHPSSPRVASAMVRLSQCYKVMGKEQESAKVLSSAYQLFQGNPSLDYSLPGKSVADGKSAATVPVAAPAAAAAPAEAALEASAIEPGIKATDSAPQVIPVETDKPQGSDELTE
jgi:tetratricopeptide (TPR) repeat protein